MANRVFDELRRWTALDDAELDAAIAANLPTSSPTRHGAHGRGGCSPWRWRRPAASRCRPSTPSARGCCTSFRSRPMSPRASRCSTRRRRRSSSNETSLGVLLDAGRCRRETARSAAALATAIATRRRPDLQGGGRAKPSASATWCAPGSITAAASNPPLPDSAERSASPPTTRIERVENEIVEGPLLPASRMGRGRAGLATRARRTIRSRRGGSEPRIGADRRGTRRESISRCSSRRNLEPRTSLVTQGLPGPTSRLCRAPVPGAARACLPWRSGARPSACRDRTAALVTIADAVISRYQAAKDRRGLLDYDDLIDKTLALLGEERAAWVHYKLDQGIDHVLIDEAQDTSPKQWEIIRRLTAEFFAGAGARAVARTIFAVGDEKQSIFSFQGAAPREFDAMRRTFTTLCRGIEQDLQYVPFRHSFRSGPERAGSGRQGVRAAGGIHADSRPTTRQTVHESLPDAAPGSVEIWDTHQARGEARDRGLGRAFRRTDGNQPAGAAGGQDRQERQALDRSRARAPATCWCWCASAGRCSRRSSAR